MMAMGCKEQSTFIHLHWGRVRIVRGIGQMGFPMSNPWQCEGRYKPLICSKDELWVVVRRGNCRRISCNVHHSQFPVCAMYNVHSQFYVCGARKRPLIQWRGVVVRRGIGRRMCVHSWRETSSLQTEEVLLGGLSNQTQLHSSMR